MRFKCLRIEAQNTYAVPGTETRIGAKHESDKNAHIHQTFILLNLLRLVESNRKPHQRATDIIHLLDNHTSAILKFTLNENEKTKNKNTYVISTQEH